MMGSILRSEIPGSIVGTLHTASYQNCMDSILPSAVSPLAALLTMLSPDETSICTSLPNSSVGDVPSSTWLPEFPPDGVRFCTSLPAFSSDGSSTCTLLHAFYCDLVLICTLLPAFSWQIPCRITWTATASIPSYDTWTEAIIIHLWGSGNCGKKYMTRENLDETAIINKQTK